MKTRLFIQNQEVELDESVQFAITRQFEDLSNPTTIINDWSKTVSIPFTQKNNNIFGHIYNADRLIAEGGTSITGIYFNPYKKLDFRLQWGDSVLMFGYAKMNEVKQNDGKGTYEITLFGQLGKLFQEMQKITFDSTYYDVSYIIDGSKYVDDYINRTLVYNSWNSSGQTQESLYPKYFYPAGSTTPVAHPAYKVTDIIGFAPNNSFSEDFDYKTFQTSSNSSTKWDEFLGTGFTADTGIEPSTVIPSNGLLPREVGEYRSYMQLPFIYWNKLFKIYQEKAEQLIGYRFDLDSEWFTASNPYWYNLVYMLKPLNFSNKDTTALVNRYKTTDDIYTWTRTTTVHPGRPPVTHYDWPGTETTNVSSFAEKTETAPLYVSGNTFQIDESTQLTSDGNFSLRLSTTGDTSDKDIKFNSDYQALVVTLTFTGVNTGNVTTKKIVFAGVNPSSENVQNLIDSADSVGLLSNPQATYYYDSNAGNYVYYVDFSAAIPQFTVNALGLDTKFNISYTVTWGIRGNLTTTSTPTPMIIGINTMPVSVKTDIVLSLNMSAKQGTFYSGSRFNLNDLWNKEYNIFDEILKYCKMYRILITVDELSKKIKFRRMPNLFADYSVLDWTNKVDMSKDYIIKPITFENKYVLFNYKDSKTSIGEEYKKRYGVNYGDYRLVTDYNFNDSKTELFKDITPSIVSTDNVLSWLTLIGHRITYTVGSEIFVNNKDKDKKQVDIFGAYFFHNGTANFDVGNGSELLYVNISDDSALQRTNSTFFYSYIQTDRVPTACYPKLDIVKGNNMCIFNLPKENYTYLDNYSGKKGIYENFWYTYINERYNVQNKKITCYVKLSPNDFISFEFNQLVKLGNQLCVVNKIYDYDITSTQPTKVDLITIQNPEGYTTDRFV